MKIEAILANPQDYYGKSLELEGYFVVIKENDEYLAFLASSAEISEAEKQQIRIAHSLAELKVMIRPLLAMQLIYRGTLTNPPYYYYFPIGLRAVVEMNGFNTPVLQEISALSLQAPYAGKMGEIVGQISYDYTAEIVYAPQLEPESQRPTKALVRSQRILQLKESEGEVLVLGGDDNRYARLLHNQTIQLGGWLHYLPAAKEGEHHFVLRSFALRSAMIAVGPLKDLTSIWIPPSALYKVLRAHMPMQGDADMRQRVEIRGKVDYRQDETLILEGISQPKLYFSEIDAVTVHEEAYLLE